MGLILWQPWFCSLNPTGRCLTQAVAANPPKHLIYQGGLGKTQGLGHISHETSKDLSSWQAHLSHPVPAHVKTAYVSWTLLQATHLENRVDRKGEEEGTVKPVWKIKLGNKDAQQLFRVKKRPCTPCLLLPSWFPATLMLLHMGNNCWTALNRKARFIFPSNTGNRQWGILQRI